MAEWSVTDWYEQAPIRLNGSETDAEIAVLFAKEQSELEEAGETVDATEHLRYLMYIREHAHFAA
jgi:hypothetical protein